MITESPIEALIIVDTRPGINVASNKRNGLPSKVLRATDDFAVYICIYFLDDPKAAEPGMGVEPV
jgi:hypothetical protein